MATSAERDDSDSGARAGLLGDEDQERVRAAYRGATPQCASSCTSVAAGRLRLSGGQEREAHRRWPGGTRAAYARAVVHTFATRSVVPRWAVACVAASLLLMAAAPSAHADGDPASDVLTEQPVFYGSALDLKSEPAAQLDALVKEAGQRGFPVNVVVISRLEDMGSVTDLYEDPERYGDFLAGEIGCCVKGRLLIVMPNGLGVTYIGHSSRADRKVVETQPAPGAVGNLLPAAIDGVVKLAAASGVELAVPDVQPAPNGVDQPITHASAPQAAPGNGGSAESGGGEWALYLVPVAALVLVACAAVGRSRWRRRSAGSG